MVTRREFMAASGTMAGAAGAASLGAGTASAATPAPGPFRHGVASGDPLADRVILWTRVSPRRPRTTPVRWLIAEDAALRRVVNQGVVSALPERDFTVKVDADGLQPGRSYWYRFEAEGAAAPPAAPARCPRWTSIGSGSRSRAAPTTRPASSTPTHALRSATISTPCSTSATTSTSIRPTPTAATRRWAGFTVRRAS
jgi:phosphodiesterase/alkaline phosphatase D-like protein